MLKFLKIIFYHAHYARYPYVTTHKNKNAPVENLGEAKVLTKEAKVIVNDARECSKIAEKIKIGGF